MTERYRRRSALAHLGLEARASADVPHAGVVLGERRIRGLLVLRGDGASTEFRSAVSKVLGLDPVVEPLTAARKRDVAILWLGPDEWLIVTPDRRIERIEHTLRDAPRRTACGADRRVAQPHHPHPLRTRCARSTLERVSARLSSPRVRTGTLRAIEARQVPDADPPGERDSGVRDLRAAQLRAVRLDLARGCGAGVRGSDRAGGIRGDRPVPSNDDPCISPCRSTPGRVFEVAWSTPGKNIKIA